MSRMIDRLINEMTADDLLTISKMRKRDLIQLVAELKQDLYRELPDAVLVDTYEERYNTTLKGWL